MNAEGHAKVAWNLTVKREREIETLNWLQSILQIAKVSEESSQLNEYESFSSCRFSRLSESDWRSGFSLESIKNSQFFKLKTDILKNSPWNGGLRKRIKFSFQWISVKEWTAKRKIVVMTRQAETNPLNTKNTKHLANPLSSSSKKTTDSNLELVSF